MTPKISIVYVTGRRVPRWEWFADSLCAQTTPEQLANLEVIFIDGQLWDESIARAWADPEIPLANTGLYDGLRFQTVEAVVRGRFPFRHLPSKPCAWQGPFRQTARDWFCAGNTRNTAFVVAQHPYVAFVDDLSVLMPGWFNQVLHAAQDEYIVCGAYKKVKQLTVVEGQVVSFEAFPPGVDSRWNHGSDGGVVPWHGSAMFGCSFGVPLEAALEVDGNDGACNGAGAEDYDFGIRLERAGWAFFYNRNMLTLESEEDHNGADSLPRASKIVSPDRLPKGYAGNPSSDHLMLHRVCHETDRVLPIIGDSLCAARAHFLRTGLVAIPRSPQTDWRDGTPLSEL